MEVLYNFQCTQQAHYQRHESLPLFDTFRAKYNGPFSIFISDSQLAFITVEGGIRQAFTEMAFNPFPSDEFVIPLNFCC